MGDGSSKYEIVLTATDKTREAFNSVKNSTNTLREDLNVVAGAFGAVALTAAAALTMMVKNSIDVADATNKAAQKVGLTTEAFSALAYAAELSDISSEALQKNLGKLASNAYTAATAGGEIADTFKTLGVEVKATDGSLKNSGVLLAELSDKFAKIPDSAEKSALAIKLFGKSGMEMIPLLNGGAEGLAKLGDEAQRLGLIIDSDVGRQAEELNDNLKRLEKASKGFANQLMSDLLPGLSQTAESMAELSKEGHPVLALFQGFAGLGKVPWDLLFPPENIRDSLSVTNQLKDLNAELSVINNRIKESEGKGLIFKWMYGSKEELQQSANIIKNQIETLQKHSAELELKPRPLKSPGEKPELIDQPASNARDKERDDFLKEEQRKREQLAKLQSKTLDDWLAYNDKLQTAKDEAELTDEQRIGYAWSKTLEDIERRKVLLQNYGIWSAGREQEYNDNKVNAGAVASAAMIRLAENEARAKQAVLQGALGSISSLMSSKNKELFEIGKAASIANSIISTIEGATKALSYGPFLGPPLAGLVMTAGLANVAMIASTQIGGGAASPTNATLGGGGSATPTPVYGGNPGGPSTPSSQNNDQPFAVQTTLTINAPGADAGVVTRIQNMMPEMIAANRNVVYGAVNQVMNSRGKSL